MPRRRNVPPAPQENKPHHEIIQRPMDEVMHISMIPYAEHVILERALPRVEDGLKPVQRRILFTLNELGVTPDKPHKKCARIVGDCLGKYHPHGDSSVYDALVRLAQPYSMRGMLVDGHGNFGSIDGDSAAAMRYTEARMAPLAMEMLRDIDKDTVPFSFNFDDTLKEPDLLPSRYPNLLVNGSSGIAVGIATNIPPHNLREAVDAAVLLMDKPDASLDEVMAVMPAPDFPTGGCLLKSSEIRTAYETGKGKLQLRARVHIEDGAAGRKLIVITEVPYQVPKAEMLQHIQQLSEEKKNLLGGIYDVRDESDREGLRAVIELRKDVDPEAVLAVLYKYSDLQVTFGVNMFAIAEGRPVQLGVREMLRCYIDHQKRVITRRTKYELEQARAREHILAGLIVAVDHLDEVIALIRKSKTVKEAREQLMNRFGLSEAQAQAILDLRLQRLTGLEIVELRREYKEILDTIDRLEGILKSEKKLIAVIRREMTEIKEKFGDERRTTLIEDDSGSRPIVEEKKNSEETTVLRMRDGQLRRVNPKLAAKILQQENGYEDIAEVLTTNTDHAAAVFTNHGSCWMLDTEKIPESQKPKDRGSMLNGLLHGIGESEHIIGLLDLEKYGKDTDILIVTKNGQVKRTEIEEFRIRRTHFSVINLKGEDEAAAVFAVGHEDKRDLMLVTSAGFAIRVRLEEFTTSGRVTAGVRGIALSDGDTVSAAFIPEKEDLLLVMTDRGYGKRILLTDLDRQARAGKGQRLMPITKSNASVGTKVVGCVPVNRETARIAVRQKRGAITRMTPGEIPVDRRTCVGVLMVSVLMDDTVEEVWIAEKQKNES